MPKYPGYESWVIPFPAGFNFTTLLNVHCNDAYELFNTRFIRLVFRAHMDKEILLSPSNPSIGLMDVRLHSALMDGYWKLSRWLARLMSGDEVNLYEFLKSKLQKELKEKRERTV